MRGRGEERVIGKKLDKKERKVISLSLYRERPRVGNSNPLYK